LVGIELLTAISLPNSVTSFDNAFVFIVRLVGTALTSEAVSVTLPDNALEFTVRFVGTNVSVQYFLLTNCVLVVGAIDVSGNVVNVLIPPIFSLPLV
jgi:hypothetical protein